MGPPDHIPGMVSGNIRRNLAVGLLYLLVFPLVVLALPFFLLYAVGTNRKGLADALAESPLAAIPPVEKGGWQSAITLFVAGILIIGVFGALLPADADRGNGDIETSESNDYSGVAQTADDDDRNEAAETSDKSDDNQNGDQQEQDSGDGSESDDDVGDSFDDEVDTTPEDGILEIHAINVGQADAMLLIAPSDETMLIDSGDWRDDGQTVLEYLDTQGVERLDHLVSTHGHADHIGGHAAVIEHYETEKDGVGQIWDSGKTHTTQTYERYLNAVEKHDVTLFETQEGDEISIDGVDATVLNPPADSAKPDDLHYNSVSIRIEHGEIGFLATGDAERAVEQRLVDVYGGELEAEIYHAGHHGSSTSSIAEFVAAVEPEMAIISSGYDSQYGHPHDEVLERFASHDIAAVWTGVHGSTVISSDGESYSVVAQADATTSPTQLRDEPEISHDPTIVPEYELHLDDDGADETEDDGADETEDETEDEESETDVSDEDEKPSEEGDSNLRVDPSSAGTAAVHTWEYDEIEFSGSVDEIMVEYPDGTSFDDLTNEDVTVTMTRTLHDGRDTSEIEVNQESYAGTSATFDLSGVYNTEMTGVVEVRIDGVENPDTGEYTALITFIGEDDELSIREEIVI